MGRLKRRVLKFGGTSVGQAPALRSALRIAADAALEAPVLVVASALSGVTNALEAAASGAAARRLDVAGFVGSLRERHLLLLAAVAQGRPALRAATRIRARLQELERGLHACAGALTPREHAALLAAGERLSVEIVAAGLSALGRDARVLDATALVRTDGQHAEACVDLAATRRLAGAALAALPLGSVPVVTGFLGASGDGETTLLGRGGSDLTATILGWALGAERVEIWSDVDGVLTADPRVDPSARTIARLSYAEATALARAGARVLHPRTLEPVQADGIPVFVGNTLRPQAPGTWIGPVPSAVAADGTAA